MNLLYVLGALSALIAAITVMACFPVVARIATAIRAVDYPGGRRTHAKAIPRMGGVAIIVGIGFGVLFAGVLTHQWWTHTATFLDLLALLMGAVLVFMVGLADDVVGTSPIQRLLVQLVAASGVVYAGWFFDRLFVPFIGEVQLGLWGGAITLVWIVGVTNAVNFLDGLDGLAGGVAAIIALSLLIFAIIMSNALMVLITAAIAGACLGFLRHNWAPARIYMGDSGSLTLGFLLAVMSLHASVKGAATVAILVPILTLGLPVIDTLLVMAVRLAGKPQGSAVRGFARVFQADRNHVHHLMTKAAPERKEIVLVIYCVAAGFCGMALAVSISRSTNLGIALVIVEVVVVVLMRSMGVWREARDLALEQRRELRTTVFRASAPVDVPSEKPGLVAIETARSDRA